MYRPGPRHHVDQTAPFHSISNTPTQYRSSRAVESSSELGPKPQGIPRSGGVQTMHGGGLFRTRSYSCLRAKWLQLSNSLRMTHSSICGLVFCPYLFAFFTPFDIH